MMEPQSFYLNRLSDAEREENKHYSLQQIQNVSKIFEGMEVSKSHHQQNIFSTNSPSSSCLRCQSMSYLSKQLQKMSNEFQQLKKENQQFRDEVQLLTANFMYILELAAINIVSGVKIRVKSILVEKQKLIEKQQQIIKRLQNQSLTLINKMDDNDDYKQKIQKLQQKIRELEAENLKLKNGSFKESYQLQDKNSIIICSTDGCSGNDNDNQRSLSSNDKTDSQFPSIPTLKLPFGADKKKSNFLMMSMKNPQLNFRQKESQRIKIQDLKLKINTMKLKLLNQKF